MDPREIEQLIIHFRDTYDEVYLTTINDVDYIWRTLTKKEHNEIAEFAVDDTDAFERICQTAVLYPETEFSTIGLAYLPERLAPQILNESGFGEYRKEQNLLSIFRNQITSNFEVQAEILINRAFPYITFEEMENWTKEKLIKYVAKAEWSLQYIDSKNIQLVTEEDRKAQKEADGEKVEEEEPQPAFDIMEVANELRKRGQDPMFVLRHLYEKEKEPYFVRPLIGGEHQTDTMLAGIDAWKNGGLASGRYEFIREQVQKIPRG